jgi:hypothetical protein
MIFTAEDVASLSESLSRWEYAEYVCAALVALACAGEYVADFTDQLTGGVEEQKKRLAKGSTLLLIVALALELTCLVKTNSLSGRLIGSLSDKAEHADEEAKQAITDSGIAEKQSVQATTDAGKASDASSAAVKASGSAMSFAQVARREADSFEKDIVSAKKQAADAESHLADALQRAASAELEVAKIELPRTLNPGQRQEVAAALSGFAGQNFAFLVFSDPESIGFLANIDSALKIAKWSRVAPPVGLGGDLAINTSGGSVPTINDIGLKLYVAPDDDAAKPAAVALAGILSKDGIPCELHLSEWLKAHGARILVIAVGQKQP